MDERLRDPVASLARREFAVDVAAHPTHSLAQLLQPQQRCKQLLATRDDIAARHDNGLLRNLGKDRLERGQVAVDVAQPE